MFEAATTQAGYFTSGYVVSNYIEEDWSPTSSLSDGWVDDDDVASIWTPVDPA